MNATSTSVNPATAIQAQPTAGKKQDNATSEASFSQVLSDEITQKRQDSNEAGKSADTDAGKGTSASKTSRKMEDSNTDTPPPPAFGSPSERDPLTQAEVPVISPEMLLVQALGQGKQTPMVTEESSDDASSLSAAVAVTQDSSLQATSPTGDALDTTPVNDPTNTPAAILALAIGANSAKSDSSTTDALEVKPATTAVANNLIPKQTGKGQASQSSQRETSLNQPHETQKSDAGQSGKTGFQAVAATLNPALASQAAVMTPQAESIKTGEAQPDILSNTSARPTPQALLEALNLPNEVTSSKLSPSVGTTAWGQALGEKIVWMAAGAQQTATLTLNPPNMGPLQIVVNIANDQASASFFSAQPEVRQALENALPKLREMMNEAGIELGQATVSADTPRQNDTPERQAQRIATPFSGAHDAVTSGLQAIHTHTPQSGRGLVDTFA